MTQSNLQYKVITGILWKLAEKIGAQGFSFIVSIILARILSPSDYGLIALITIFISISGVLVSSGLANSLIQKKDADDEDFSSVFYFNIFISIVLYAILFISAPYIATFYNKLSLIPIIRVLSISVLIYGINNVQQAYVSKTMQFKRFFFSTLIGTILSGIVGIYMGYNGFGVWALVVQQLLNSAINTIVLWFTVKWRPKRVFSITKLKELLSFGWKLLISNLIGTIYNNLYSLIIGKVYNSSFLGLYNKGEQIPYIIVSNINGPIQNVLFPALALQQDNKERLKSMVRRSIVTTSFLIFPMMIGLVAIAKSLVLILLTKKWIDCVFFLQMSCIALAFQPVQTANMQAINALGRSDIFLKLEIINKVIGISILVLSIPFGIKSMAIGKVIHSFITSIINAYPNKKFLNYSIMEQFNDLVPSLILSLIMGIIVWSVEFIGLNIYITMLIQILLGIIIYFGLAYLFKFECFHYILSLIKKKKL